MARATVRISETVVAEGGQADQAVHRVKEYELEGDQILIQKYSLGDHVDTISISDTPHGGPPAERFAASWIQKLKELGKIIISAIIEVWIERQL